MAKIMIGNSFQALPYATGTIQNNGSYPIEVSETQTEGAGAVVFTGKAFTFDGVTLYARTVTEGKECEVRVLPFLLAPASSSNGGGGNTAYVLPAATADALGGVTTGQFVSGVTPSGTNLTLEKGDGTTVDVALPMADNSRNGFMSAAHYDKLEGLENYTLPEASPTVLGGIKVGDNLYMDNDGVLHARTMRAVIRVKTIPGAVVTCNGMDDTADENGIAMFTVYDFDTYPITADFNGEASLPASVEVLTATVYDVNVEFASTEHYGFYLDENDPVENTCIHYLLDNASYTPIGMDFQADAFSYGSWQNAFFMPKPCMLRTDGTVDYYLNPDNYAEKEDGTASDVANEAYDGNAMVEFPAAYIKVVNDTAENKIYFYVSNHKLDADYECYPCMKEDGTYNDNFYMAIYEGCTIDNKLRSLSGKEVGTSTDTNFTNLLTRAGNNGEGYLMTTWGDEDLIRVLGMMIMKRLNSQLAIGYGNNKQGNNYTTGAGNEKGLFYGTETQNDVGIKFFGIENLWGSRYRRVLGVMTDDANNVYVKNTLHRGDGSTGTTYMGQSWYRNLGQIAGNGFQAYFTKMAGKKGYMTMPIEANGGSSTTYFCDQGDVSANRLLVVGGFGDQGGLFGFRNSVNNKTASMIGASLTYRRS